MLVVVLLWSLNFHVTDVVGGDVMTTRFSLTNSSYVCKPLQYLVDNAHLLDTASNASSSIECTALCGRNDTCLGTMKTSQGGCHLLRYSQDVMNITGPHCPPEDKVLAIRRRRCDNGGSPSSQWPRVCDCQGGWAGLFCHRLASNCQELKQAGHSGGWTLVNLQIGNMVVPAVCSFGNPVKVLLFASTGTLDQRHSWQDYVKGYYINNGDLFIGLEALHALTKVGDGRNKVNVKNTLLNKTATRGKQKQAYNVNYFNLTVSDASTGYQLDFDSVSASIRDPIYVPDDAFDCMVVSKGANFSTWDNDQDADHSKNCAKISMAGWWFNTCEPFNYCSPLGRTSHYLPENATGGYIAIPGLNLTELPYSTLTYTVKSNLQILIP